MTAAEVLAKHGTLRAAEVVELAAAAGLELAAAATLLEKESSGGRNIFGNDKVETGGFYVKGGEVTEEAFGRYKAHRKELGAQGVGPTQLTLPAFQDRADDRGGCFDWRVNCSVGFEILAGLIKENGIHHGFRIYNGGPQPSKAAESYAEDAVKKLDVWRSRLAGAVGEEEMPLNDADKQWLRQEIRDAINEHADKLFRWADHGGGDPPTASPPNHPHSHKAILDHLDALERRLSGSS
jgi:hypothetical protein